MILVIIGLSAGFYIGLLASGLLGARARVEAEEAAFQQGVAAAMEHTWRREMNPWWAKPG